MQLGLNTALQQGKYRIIRVLGQGGFGITYLAIHTLLDKYVAIKEFFPKDYCDREETTSLLTIGTRSNSDLVDLLKAKFVKEAKNISKLHHPNIITIHDVFLENNTAYYVMDYVDGHSLADVLKQNNGIDEATAITYIRKIAAAVGYMHSLNMNHLDLKPANIMLRNEDGEPILIDFGLSKQYDASGSQTSTTPIGISHGYAPIEQYRPGGVTNFTPQTDIYALGATLYALVTGATPPHYSTILEDGFPDFSVNLSSSTITAIKKSMEVRKANRPSSIDEFLMLLDDVVVKSNAVESCTTDNICNDDLNDNKHTEDQKINSQDTKGDKEISEPSESDALLPKSEEPLPSEETVILNFSSFKSECKNSDDESNKVPSPTVDIPGELSYIDLGLSVKWATQTVGTARPSYTSEVYSFILKSGRVVSATELQFSYDLPSRQNFEELLNRCSWSPFSENGIHGYKIVGPNGNILIMPLASLNRYLSKECLTPDMPYYYSLYLGEYTHTIAQSVPTQANIWPVKNR